jgi:hypothetical protein
MRKPGIYVEVVFVDPLFATVEKRDSSTAAQTHR